MRRLFGQTPPPELAPFADAVNEAYHQFEDERRLLERSLGLTSEELVARNQHLQRELEKVQQMQARLEAELAERQRVEESLRRNVVRLDAAQRLAGMGYWEWDTATGRVFFSDETFRIFGYAPGAVAPSQRLFLQHVVREDLDKLTRYVRLSRRGTSRELEYRIRRVEGEVRMLRASSQRALNAAGRPTQLFGIVVDVTQQWMREESLVEARQQAEAAQRHAEALLLAKNSLLDNIGHELRTPLTAILGFADVLALDLEGQPREFARLIAQSGERLLETFNAVLDLATLESGRDAFQVQPCNLASVCEAVAREMTPLAEAKALTLDFEPPAQPVSVSADGDALHRILHNLVANAVKFTHEGGVTLRVAMGTSRDGRACGLVEVEDTGPGISPAFLPNLFEPFEQESKGMARRHEGAGLGLAVARGMARRMGGDVEVESWLGRGSIFRLVMPVGAHLRLVQKDAR